jgi:hypothetical protein
MQVALVSPINNLLFLKLFAHSLQRAQFGVGMKLDPIGMKLGALEETTSDFLGNRILLSPIGQANVQNQFVDFHGIIVGFTQLDLPTSARAAPSTGR